MIDHEYSLDEQQYYFYVVYCNGGYPVELSNNCITYNTLLDNNAARITPGRWRWTISKHTRIRESDWSDDCQQMVDASCLIFKRVSQLLASHMISCSLGLSAFQEWLECKGLDNYVYNETTHKNAAVYFIKAVEHILRGKCFGDIDDFTRNFCSSAKVKDKQGKDVTRQVKVSSRGGEEITGYSYDCLTCGDRRVKPITATVEGAYKAVIDNNSKKISNLSDYNSFSDSGIGQRLMGPWLHILDVHQAYLWNQLREMIPHSRYIREYFSLKSSIDGEGLDHYGKWDGMRPVALFSKGEWLCRLNGARIERNINSLMKAIKKAMLLKPNEQKTTSAKKRKVTAQVSTLGTVKKKKKKVQLAIPEDESSVSEHPLQLYILRLIHLPGQRESMPLDFYLRMVQYLSVSDLAALSTTCQTHHRAITTNYLQGVTLPGHHRSLTSLNKRKRPGDNHASLKENVVDKKARKISMSPTSAPLNKNARKREVSTSPTSASLPTSFTLPFRPLLSEQDKEKADKIRNSNSPTGFDLKSGHDYCPLPRYQLKQGSQELDKSKPLPPTVKRNLFLSKQGVKSLADEKYINDEAIFVSATMFNNNEYWRKIKNPNHRVSYTFPSHFVEKLCYQVSKDKNKRKMYEKNYDPSSVDTWGGSHKGAMDIFEAHELFFQVNENDQHWFNVIIDPNSLEETMGDSLHEDMEPETQEQKESRSWITKCLFDWIIHQHKIRMGSIHPKHEMKWSPNHVKGHDDLGNVMQVSVDCGLNIICLPFLRANNLPLDSLGRNHDDKISAGRETRRRIALMMSTGRNMFALEDGESMDESDLRSNGNENESSVHGDDLSTAGTRSDDSDREEGKVVSTNGFGDFEEEKEEEEVVRNALDVIEQAIETHVAVEDHGQASKLVDDLRKLFPMRKVVKRSDSTGSDNPVENDSIKSDQHLKVKQRKTGNGDQIAKTETAKTETTAIELVDTECSIDLSSSTDLERDQEERRNRNLLDLENLINRYNVFQKSNQRPMAAQLDLLHVVTGGLGSMIFQNQLQNLSSLVMDFVYVLLPLIQAQQDMRKHEVTALTEMVAELQQGKQAQIGKLLSLIENTESNDDDNQPELKKTIATALGLKKDECSTKEATDFLRLKPSTKRVLMHSLNFLMVKYVLDNMKLSDLHRNCVDGAQGDTEGDSLMYRVRDFAIEEKAPIEVENDPNISSILTSVIMPALMKDDNSVSKSATELLIGISDVMIGRPTNDKHFDEKVMHHFAKAESLTMLGETSEEPKFEPNKTSEEPKFEPITEPLTKKRDRRRSIVRTWLILTLQNPLRKKFGFNDCVEFTRAILLSLNSSDMYSKLTFINKQYFSDSDKNKIKLKFTWRTNTKRRSLLISDNRTIDSLQRLYDYAYNKGDEKKRE